METPHLSGLRAFIAFGLMVAGLLTVLAAPESRLRASACGEHGDELCRTTTTCIWVLRDPCSSTYEYYSKKNKEEEDEPNDEQEETPEGGVVE